MNDSSLWKRICPICKDELRYKTYMSWYSSCKKNKPCGRCSAKTGSKKRWTKERRLERSKKYSGEGNPFYGKTHSKEFKEKYTEKRKTWNWKMQTDEYRNLQSKLNSGKNNFFYNKSLYEVFVEKYGKEIADSKWNNRKEILSIKNEGKNNPMYGKPSPHGSGNGWSGWYKGWFFRSLKELSYMINVIERFNLQWKSVEKREFAIPYTDWKGTSRNYFPDFLIESKYIVEIKPKKLWNTPTILAKKNAAKVWCEKKGYKYKIVEPKILTTSKILDLHRTGEIKFLEKYEIKFKEKYLK